MYLQKCLWGVVNYIGSCGNFCMLRREIYLGMSSRYALELLRFREAGVEVVFKVWITSKNALLILGRYFACCLRRVSRSVHNRGSLFLLQKDPKSVSSYSPELVACFVTCFFICLKPNCTCLRFFVVWGS